MTALQRLLPLLSLPRGFPAPPSRRFAYARGRGGDAAWILGVGTDLVERARIAQALGEPRFRETVCGPGELRSLDALGPEDAVALAARVFAAKEALFKALGPARCRGVAAPDLEISDEGDPGALRPGSRALGLLERLGVDWMEVVVAELPLLTVAVAAVGAGGSP